MFSVTTLKDNNVAIPVTNMDDLMKICSSNEDGTHSIGGMPFTLQHVKINYSKKGRWVSPYQKLVEVCKNKIKHTEYSWSDELHAEIPSSWEIHGDLVLLPLTAFSSDIWHQFGKADNWNKFTIKD